VEPAKPLAWYHPVLTEIGTLHDVLASKFFKGVGFAIYPA